MPKYFFQLGPSPRAERVGQELPDIQAAKCAAVRLIAETLCEHPQDFWDTDSHQVTVTDQGGLVQFAIDIFTTTSPVAQASIRRRERSKSASRLMSGSPIRVARCRVGSSPRCSTIRKRGLQVFGLA